MSDLSENAPSSDATTRKAQWDAEQERSNVFALRVIVWIALNLGRTFARLCLWPISIYFWLAVPKARAASAQYLRKVERASGRPARSLSTLKHIATFAAIVLDRVYMMAGQTYRFENRVENFHAMRRVHESGTSGLFIGAHLGSFEALRILGTRDPVDDTALPELTVRMAMYEDNARKINAMLEAINPNASSFVISLGQADAMLQLQETLERGEFVGMLADRHIGESRCEMIDFLGEPAPFPIGPFRLAMVLKRPVFLMFGLYRGGNRYDIFFDSLPPPEAANRQQQLLLWQQAYVKRIETYCKLEPYNWFNFYDFWHQS
jgi:predicted LPLAT superfamily acyltransferase